MTIFSLRRRIAARLVMGAESNMDGAKVRIDITLTGRVQGVAFRWYTQKKALSLGLTGWVRNQADGSVRIVAEGPRTDLETFCDWAARGPDHARVDRREFAWSEAAGNFDDFLITG
jgi:acylphosphatase